MSFFKAGKIKVGIEVCAEKIVIAQSLQKKVSNRVLYLSNVNIESKILKPLFKKQNIIDEKLFIEYIQKSLKLINTRTAGIALPDACFKVFIKKYPDMPANQAEIKDMVMWSIVSSVNIPAEELRISYQNMGKNYQTENIFLIVIAMEDVLMQYEQAFKKSGVTPSMIAPVGLNRFNFYSEEISEIGNVFFLSLFDDSLTAFVFSEGIPVFYKVIKKGLIRSKGTSAVEDMDMLLQLFSSKFPDFDIDQFFIASNIKSDFQIEQLLQDINPVEFTIINEDGLVEFDETFKTGAEYKPLSFYSSALGTVQSM